jgi:CspA family cold shock protein
LIFVAEGAILRKICFQQFGEPRRRRMRSALSGGLVIEVLRKSERSRDAMPAQQGTVKWFNNAKGYGFIQLEEGGEDIFVHHTAIVSEGYRSLNQGERVNFEIVQGPKGLQARNVLRA